MVIQLRPGRGGFLRPFDCGWFIREFLLGNGPEGSPKIDPGEGAVQEDIFYHYKVNAITINSYPSACTYDNLAIEYS